MELDCRTRKDRGKRRQIQTVTKHSGVSSPAALSPSGLALSSFMSTMQCPRCCVPSSICPACPTVLPRAPPPLLPPPPRNTTVQSSSPAHTQPSKQRSCHKDSNPLTPLSCCLTVRSLSALRMPHGN